MPARDWSGKTFITVQEAADELRVVHQTVRNWIDDRELAAVRVGRRIRIARSDFNRFLDANYTGRTDPLSARPLTNSPPPALGRDGE